jgi:hypothetical protein
VTPRISDDYGHTCIEYKLSEMETSLVGGDKGITFSSFERGLSLSI